ncbi:MAG: acyltransferase [Hyalangium sp.]|uniref:acyltransferase n=1 Tax=Hyalangium sp. TaxID=2028555 RepID=UPI003899E42E
MDLYSLYERAQSRLRVQALVLRGYRGSRRLHVGPGFRANRPDLLEIADRCMLGAHVSLQVSALSAQHPPGRIQLGAHVFLGAQCIVESTCSVSIGADTMLGPNCYINDTNHGMSLGTPMRLQLGTAGPVVIGEDCWLGAGVIVLKGVTIGRGTVVAAGSVVTRSLPENVVAAGVPARVLRART